LPTHGVTNNKPPVSKFLEWVEWRYDGLIAFAIIVVYIAYKVTFSKIKAPVVYSPFTSSWETSSVGYEFTKVAMPRLDNISQNYENKRRS
jgi:hypothetical protein